MLSRRSVRLSLLALSLVAGRAVAAQTPDELLAKYAKAVDPEGKIGSIQGMKSTMTMEMAAMGMTATISSVQRRPNQVAVTISLPGIGEMRSGYDGTIAWSSDPMQGARIMSGLEAATIADGADMNAMLRPASLFSASAMAGEAEIDGEKCLRVKHTWKSGRVTTDCYSTKTGLIIETLAKQSSPQGELDAVSKIGDYRSVGGLMMPHKITVQVMGMEQVMKIVSAEVGDIDPALVAAPADVKALKKP